MDKHNITIFVMFFILLPLVLQTHASVPNNRMIRERVLERVNERIENREQKSSPEGIMKRSQNFIQKIKNKVEEKLNWARLSNAMVIAVSGSAITATVNGKTYTINTDGNTVFKRHFWGKSSIAEIEVNNKINVWGKYIDDAKLTVQARLIRNISVMKRFGTFVGTVEAVSGSIFTLNTGNRGAQSVTFSSTTKCVNRKQESMNCSDIKNGERTAIKGVWDATNNTITEVTHIKDYSIPVKITPTATPAPTI